MAEYYPSQRYDTYHLEWRGVVQYTEYDGSLTAYSGVGVKQTWTYGSCTAQLRIASGILYAELDTGSGFEIVNEWILSGTQYRIGSGGNLFIIQDYDGSYSTIDDWDYPGYAGTRFRIGVWDCQLQIREWDGSQWQIIDDYS